MKRILLIMTLLLAGVAGRAGEPYCCTTPGRTLVYERTKANGRIDGLSKDFLEQFPELTIVMEPTQGR